VFTLATGLKRCLATPDSKTAELKFPRVSPDGTTVAYMKTSTLKVADIYAVSFAGGTRHRQPAQKLMTIAAGLICHDGIVLCADTQESYGEYKWPVEKLVTTLLGSHFGFGFDWALPTPTCGGNRSSLGAIIAAPRHFGKVCNLGPKTLQP
jgi:hypothetical protein